MVKKRALSLLALLPLAVGCGQWTFQDIDPSHARIINGRTGDSANVDELMADLRGADIVYVGEHHDEERDHQVQLMILRALAEREHLGFGMEMFQAPFQGALDSYLADEIGEVAMLRETEWRTRWGFRWELYAPMVRFARENQIPVVALNAPSELTKAVARRGIEGLTDEERDQLPDMDLTDQRHRTFIKKLLEQHHPGMGSFEKFYAAQVLWDETMAQNAVTYVTGGEDLEANRPIVIIAGTGHVHAGLGIPSRVARRLKSGKGVTVIPSSRGQAKAYIREGAADWLWVVSK